MPRLNGQHHPLGSTPETHCHHQRPSESVWITLGELKGQSDRNTELLLALHDKHREHLDQIQALREWMITQISPLAAARSHPKSRRVSRVRSALAAARDLFQVAIPFILLAALVAGKLTWPEVAPVLRSFAGL